MLVVISPPDSEPNEHSLIWRGLNDKIEDKLKEAGIRITPGVAGNILNIPELRTNIEMLKLDNSKRYVFRVETTLARAVHLAKKPNLGTKADVWKSAPAMQTASVKEMPAAVTDVALEQADAFITGWLDANPKSIQPTDVRTSNTVSQTILKKPGKPEPKPAVAKYKYVASKNSKVFHKPDCSWAKRIKPKNLVGYNSRDEAIKAGKRPCKMCKP